MKAVEGRDIGLSSWLMACVMLSDTMICSQLTQPQYLSATPHIVAAQSRSFDEGVTFDEESLSHLYRSVCCC